MYNPALRVNRMDAPNMSRKRKSDHGELSLNDANVMQGSEGVNKNLLKCLVVLTKHIIDVHNNKHEPVHTVINLEAAGSCETGVTEQNIATEPHFPTMSDSLWRNISLLKQQTAELEKIYNTPQTNSSKNSSNQTNYTTIDNVLRAHVVQHLSENSANLTEQICNLISMYKSEESEESARGIRKCLSKINKKIKSIPVQSDVFFSSLNKSKLSSETNAYLTAAHNLSDKLSVLIKKVSKLKKIYRKRVLNVNKSEPVVKKRKLFNISSNESIVIDNHNDTFNNSAVKNSNQVTNNNELSKISTVNNDNSIESLDKSLLEPYNSNYVNELLHSYETVTNNAKRKRKLKEERAWSDNLVIKIESDDDSVAIVKKKDKTVHGVLVQNDENIIEERLKKTAKKKRKSVDNSNENTQAVLIKINENSTEKVSEENRTKTVKKKKKSVVNFNENAQEILVKNNENFTAIICEENPKKIVKKKRKSVENSNDNVQEILLEINENSTETVCEKNLKKAAKKKRKFVENSTENARENLIKNNGNVIETACEEIPKKTAKKKKKSVENSNEHVRENLFKNNENSTATVSEEKSKKTPEKKRKSAENAHEILVNDNENSTATVSDGNLKKTAKKKRKSVENSNENAQEILFENNENSTATVSDENRKKAVKTKNKSLENAQEILVNENENSTRTVSEENTKKIAKKKRKSVENTREILTANTETSLNVNEEKTRRKKQIKKKKNNDGLTENILNDILHQICAHVVHSDENDESPIERHNDSEVQKRRKDDGNKENVSVLKDNCENTTKVKRKEKIMTDSRNVEVEGNQMIREKTAKISTEYFTDDTGIAMEKKKRKSNKKKCKSLEFIVECSEESNSEIVVQNSNVETTDSVLRQVENNNENDIDTTPLLARKKKRKNVIENLTENKTNEQKSHKKIKSAEIIEKISSKISFNTKENTLATVSEENSKKTLKKHKNRDENAEREVLVENTEINCKRKDKKRRKSTESRIGNCWENTEKLLVDTSGTNGNVNDEMTSKKTVETVGNIKIQPQIENVSAENDIIPRGRSNNNTDQENVPKSEQFIANLTKKPLLESTLTNMEIVDDIFSSVFKIEPLDDVGDSDLNFVPLNNILLDEDLDEKEQYLHLRDLIGTAKEKMDLTEDTKDRLRSLCVLLDFDVPAAHTIETHLCKGPSQEQAQQMAALGVKTGRLTRDEDEIIRRNWASFYKVHDLPNDPAPFLALQHGQEKLISFEDRRKFVQYLGKDLPHRALHSIYRRFKILFKVTKEGRFSQDEDTLILLYVKFSGHGAKFADLMPLLNRSRMAIETRYRVLTKSLTRVSWDLNLKAGLIKHMKQVMSVANVSELQYADITHAHLAEVAKRMDLPVVKIRHQWCTKLYTQLFAAKPLYLDQMKVDLVDRLYELKLDDWRKVNWCEVAKTFPGVSPVSLRVLMKTLFRHNCPKKLQADLGAIINHCRTITLPELKSRPEFNQRYIYRLKVKQDGGLREYI